MSGFEIAGVILGGLPLLISFLENYTKIVEAGHTWRRFARQVRRLSQEIETERVIFKDTCEKFLVGIVPPSEVDKMIQNPGSWWGEAIPNVLHSRLGESFNSFRNIIQDMEQTYEDIKKKLGMDSGNDVCALYMYIICCRVMLTLYRSPRLQLVVWLSF